MKIFSKVSPRNSEPDRNEDTLRELRDLVAELELAGSNLRKRAGELGVRRLIETAERFGLSWSGSPVGYHALVYVEDFKKIEAGEHFSMEWGFERAFSNYTAGRWCEYTYEEVYSEVVQRSKVEMSALEAATGECISKFDSLREKALPLLDFLNVEYPSDATVKEVTGSCKQIQSSISQSAIGLSMLGRKQFRSRDMRAAHQGVMVPPHLAVLAFTMHQESVMDACQELAKSLNRLVNYLERRMRASMSNASRNSSATEVVDSSGPATSLGSQTSLKLLFVAANPSDAGRLALDKEMREISHKVARVRGARPQGAPEIEIVSAWAAQPSDLLHSLNEHRPDIVHFSGHGSSTGELILTNQDGTSQPVTAKALKRLFAVVKDNVRVVLLNACYSSIQAEAIQSEVEFVIGMTDGIGDKAAILFASTFYGGLSFGRTVREAFEQGVVALLLEDIPEENVPVLIG